MSHAEAIQKSNDVLQRCTTINLYVIDFLGAKDVLDEAQESDLRAERSHLRQRILLFQWLKVVPSHRYESFLQVMKDAEQEHVANLLTGSTEDDHLPLSDARYARLRKIRHKMAEVTQIDNEVIAELRRSKAISMTDAEELRAETVDYAKVSKLIGAIMRRSNHSYNSFQEVLRKTFQTAAADFLKEGEMPAVHLNNNRPDLDAPLSLAFNGVIRDRTTDDAEIEKRLADLNGLGLNPVKAIPGQSIVIFIYCKTVHNAVKFTQLFDSGRLQHILESILNRLLITMEPHNAKTLDSNISLEDEEVITLEEFTGIEDWMIESFKRQKLSGEIYGCDATTQTGSMIESFKRQTPSGDKYGCDATTQTGWMRERSNRPKPLGKICGCDASTQTDEESFMKTKTDLMPVEFEETTFGSRILCGTETQTKLQLEDDFSYVYDGVSAELEKMTYESSVHSSTMSHIADDDSGVYEYLNSLVMPKPSFVTQRHSIPEDIDDIVYPDLSARSEDVFSMKRIFTETQKEKDKLKKLLEHHTDIGELPEKYKSHPILLQTIRTKAAKEKQKSIRGFTILDKELFVVSENSSEIEVYDSMNFSFRRRWILKELIDPRDIVCCSINKCLYMFNVKVTGWPNNILRVDPNGELIKTWSTGGDYGYGLSVTHETNVILTVTNQNKLYEYSPDGQLILEVNLSSDAGIHWPWHAVKLTNGHFVVSYGEDDDDMHSVCVVDADGKLKKSFCEKCRPIIGHMDYPMHLAVDENGFVMVADRENSRVLLLNSDLEFKREILSKEKHGLGNPTRIHLDESTGRLFVADRGWNSQQISIFSLDNYY